MTIAFRPYRFTLEKAGPLFESMGYKEKQFSFNWTNPTVGDLREYASWALSTMSGTEDDTTECNLLNAEIKWATCGSPYYKIWPGMVESLKHTKFNFTADNLAAPFPVFSVMLPTGGMFDSGIFCIAKDNVDVHSTGIQCDAMMIAAIRGEHRMPHAISFPFFRGATVEECLQRYSAGGVKKLGGHEDTVEELHGKASFIRCAIAAAMFAINRHKLVAPDIDQEVLLRKLPGGRSKASQKIAQEKRDREISKCKGWKVGSEIDLPRPHVVRSGQPVDRGEELTCGHIRSGHMRMQPCGPNNQDRKLIFVEPTIVRPDLPIRQMHGYRIRTKAERKLQVPK